MVGDADVDDAHGGAVERSLAGDVDDERRLDLGVLDHVAADLGKKLGVDEVAAGARLDGHGEADWRWGGVHRRYRLVRGGLVRCEEGETHAGGRRGRSRGGPGRRGAVRVV